MMLYEGETIETHLNKCISDCINNVNLYLRFFADNTVAKPLFCLGN